MLRESEKCGLPATAIPLASLLIKKTRKCFDPITLSPFAARASAAASTRSRCAGTPATRRPAPPAPELLPPDPFARDRLLEAADLWHIQLSLWRDLRLVRREQIDGVAPPP